jgi:hypothetical protein
MKESEAENLIEESLSARRPREAFRARLLDDSTAALVQTARSRARWRMAGLAAVAVLIATVSFLCGQMSVLRPGAQRPTVAGPGPSETETVGVPAELVTWLETARLFERLGMEKRVAHAYERASRLVPYDATLAVRLTDSTYAAGDRQSHDRSDPPETTGPDRGRPNQTTNRIMAQSLGG